MGTLWGTTLNIQEEVQELIKPSNRQICPNCKRQVQHVYKANKNMPLEMDKKIQSLLKKQINILCNKCKPKIRDFYERVSKVNKIGSQQSKGQIGKKQQGFSNNSQNQAQTIIVISQFVEFLSRGDFIQVVRTLKKVPQKDVLLFKMAAGYELIKRTLEGNQQQDRFTSDMVPPQGCGVLKKVEISYKKLTESNNILLNQQKQLEQSKFSPQKTTKSVQGQVNSQSSQIKQLQKRNDQLLKSIASLKSENQQLKAKQKEKDIQIDRLKQSLLNRNNQLKKLTDQINELKTKLYGKQSEIQKLARNCNQLKTNNTQLNKNIKVLINKNSDLDYEFKKCSEETKNLKENLTQKNAQLRQLSIKQKQQKGQFNKLFYQREKLKEDNKKLLQQIQKSKTGSLLQTSQLKELTQQLKATFSQMVSLRFNKRIRNTHILYRFDSMNPVNFHKYIDGHENILLIYKTKGYKTIFAGSFSLGKLRPNQNLRQDSIVFSLTQNKFFNPKKNIQNYVSICYEQNLFIIGNSELRIKHRESSVFSNFGIMMGCYDAEGRNYEVFVGESEQKKCDLEGYEIYSIQFE